MRLTFFMMADLRTGRGVENVLFNLLKYKPRDIDITIIEPDNIMGERISQNEVDKLTEGCKIIRIHKYMYKTGSMLRDVYLNSILRPPYKNLKYAKNHGLLPEIRKTDIVYLFQNNQSVFFKDMDIPIIGSTHTLTLDGFASPKDLPHKIYGDYLYRTYFKNINGFNYFPRDFSMFNRLKEKWHLKYNFLLTLGVDTKMFYPDNHNLGNKIKILFVASLEYSKGLDILIPLIEKLKSNSNIEFHIVGKGPLENELNKIDYIKYHGVLTNKELANLYRECDLFVYPSHNDTYSLVTLQALSSGLYVLAGDFFKGIFDDFNKYLEYLPMNVDAFYNRINDIIRDRTIIGHSRQEEHDYVKNNYDWSIIAKKFYTNMQNIYDEFYQNRKGEDSPKD